MSEKPSGEKTEQPTQKRQDEARSQGQVVRSADVVTTLSTIAVLATVMWLVPGMASDVESFARGCFNAAGGRDEKALQVILSAATGLFLKLVLPVALASIVAVVLANVGQTGFVFASKAIEPSISKLNPFEGVKKIFALKNLMEFVKAVLKVSIIAILIYVVVKESLDPVSKLPHMGINATLHIASQMFVHLVVLLVFAYAIIASADYFLQRKVVMQELMMTKDEVKREGKEMEGDPHVKGERRRIAQEIVFSDTAGAVKKSTVMVTNPTHYAVALYYERGVTEIPILLAKGSGFLALRMIELAREESIPIVQNIPLAQDLHARVDVDTVVPDDLLETVADILRWVQTLPPRISRS
jgi:type III secretion protein U